MRIVRTLIARQACIGCDLVDETGLAQSTVSEHLRILKAAGIITGEIERPRVCYSLNLAALRPLRKFLQTAESSGRLRSAGGA
jgi:ArsR family transcriptional regulator